MGVCFQMSPCSWCRLAPSRKLGVTNTEQVTDRRRRAQVSGISVTPATFWPQYRALSPQCALLPFQKNTFIRILVREIPQEIVLVIYTSTSMTHLTSYLCSKAGWKQEVYLRAVQSSLVQRLQICEHKLGIKLWLGWVHFVKSHLIPTFFFHHFSFRRRTVIKRSCF